MGQEGEPEKFMIPEIPYFPDIIIPKDWVVPKGGIVIPPLCLCTYGIYCTKCGNITHGSRCCESFEEMDEWMKIQGESHICDKCQV